MISNNREKLNDQMIQISLYMNRFSEADVTVDVQNLDPVFDSSLNREEEQTFLRNLDE